MPLSLPAVSLSHKAASPSTNHDDEGLRLFVGNLSTLFNETELALLVSPYGKVKDVQLQRSPASYMDGTDASESLCGFVTLDSAKSTRRAARVLHGMEFMGRHLNVKVVAASAAAGEGDQTSGRQHSSHSTLKTQLIRMEFSFESSQIKLITEIHLRRIFAQYGRVLEISILRQTFSAEKQTGRGFVCFSNLDDALHCEEVLNNQDDDYDIEFDCSVVLPSSTNFEEDEEDAQWNSMKGVLFSKKLMTYHGTSQSSSNSMEHHDHFALPPVFPSSKLQSAW